MPVYLAGSRRSLTECVGRVLEAFAQRLDLDRGILLKPNIVFPVPGNSGEITRPVIVKAVVEALRRLKPDVDIIIGEGTAAGTNPVENFQKSGFTRLATELSVPLVNLDEVERENREWAYGKLGLPKLALTRTYINLPILKPSSAAGISGAMKNQKGLISPQWKKKFHRLGLDGPLVQLNLLIQPQLTILDGRNFFSGQFLIGGDNTGEIDATICRLLDIEIPEHVRQAADAALFREPIQAQGDQAWPTRNLRKLKRAEFKELGGLRLWSNPWACTMCRAVFQQIRDHPFNLESIHAAMKLLPYAARGTDIVFGRNARFKRTKSKLICIGNCTKKLADIEGGVFVPGCPPKLDDLARRLSRD